MDFINNNYKFNYKFFSFSLYSLSLRVRISLTAKNNSYSQDKLMLKEMVSNAFKLILLCNHQYKHSTTKINK